MDKSKLLNLILYWGAIGFFLAIELLYSYRQPTVSKLKRWSTNIPLSIVNGIIYNLIYAGVIVSLLSNTEKNGWGLLNYPHLPGWLRVVLGIIILDFVIYLWHVSTHYLPFLWRFHQVHHSDMNMDVSTANRFHLGEFLISGLVRLMVIYSMGIPLQAYLLFEILVNISIQFHHSSLKIHPILDKIWMFLFISPSMHRVHHSVRQDENNSNFGVLLSIWDRFLGTKREANQDTLIIGLKYLREFKQLGFFQSMVLPFKKNSR